MKDKPHFWPDDLETLEESFMSSPERSAVLIFPGVVEMWAEKNPRVGCSLRLVNLPALVASSLPLQKDSELKPVIDLQLQQMREHGKHKMQKYVKKVQI